MSFSKVPNINYSILYLLIINIMIIKSVAKLGEYIPALGLVVYAELCLERRTSFISYLSFTSKRNVVSLVVLDSFFYCIIWCIVYLFPLSWCWIFCVILWRKLFCNIIYFSLELRRMSKLDSLVFEYINVLLFLLLINK